MTPQGEPTGRGDAEEQRPRDGSNAGDRPVDGRRMPPRAFVVAFAAPWIMVLAVFGAAIGGVLLDRRLGTSPILTVTLIVAGVLGGGFQAYRTIMKVLGGK
jgi:hypothetical protein